MATGLVTKFVDVSFEEERYKEQGSEENPWKGKDSELPPFFDAVSSQPDKENVSSNEEAVSKLAPEQENELVKAASEPGVTESSPLKKPAEGKGSPLKKPAEGKGSPMKITATQPSEMMGLEPSQLSEAIENPSEALPFEIETTTTEPEVKTPADSTLPFEITLDKPTETSETAEPANDLDDSQHKSAEEEEELEEDGSPRKRRPSNGTPGIVRDYPLREKKQPAAVDKARLSVAVSGVDRLREGMRNFDSSKVPPEMPEEKDSPRTEMKKRKKVRDNTRQRLLQYPKLSLAEALPPSFDMDLMDTNNSFNVSSKEEFFTILTPDDVKRREKEEEASKRAEAKCKLITDKRVSDSPSKRPTDSPSKVTDVLCVGTERSSEDPAPLDPAGVDIPLLPTDSEGEREEVVTTEPRRKRIKNKKYDSFEDPPPKRVPVPTNHKSSSRPVRSKSRESTTKRPVQHTPASQRAAFSLGDVVDGAETMGEVLNSISRVKKDMLHFQHNLYQMIRGVQQGVQRIEHLEKVVRGQQD